MSQGSCGQRMHSICLCSMGCMIAEEWVASETGLRTENDRLIDPLQEDKACADTQPYIANHMHAGSLRPQLHWSFLANACIKEAWQQKLPVTVCARCCSSTAPLARMKASLLASMLRRLCSTDRLGKITSFLFDAALMEVCSAGTASA